MNGQNKGWELGLAGPEDSEGIQNVFEDGDFQGKISVKFSRAPDPYQSFLNDGDDVIMPVVRDAGTKEILGIGGCVIRREHVNGALRNTGYLTGLKILQSRQRKINCIIPAYKLIGERAAAYDPYFYTTILESNEAAIRLLEKRRRHMPPYIYIGDYAVYCLAAGTRAGGGGGYVFKRGHTEAVAEFYRETLPGYNLSPKDEWLYGLTGDDFYSLREADGKILAACALWDQQSYKQYIITGYSGIYKYLSYIPVGVFGYPPLPIPGAPANYASIAALIVRDGDPTAAARFIRQVLYEAGGYDFAMLGLFENHPLAGAVRKMRHIQYRSRLYAVDYSGNDAAELRNGLDGRPVMLEVGLL